ncbi:hypothetical protein BGW80DRAFT_1271060 [Lactifluus volemus]|nr:hypothetical protein BGW80DRAFT_1271060 [Lactifluus volemus]
MAPLRMLSGLRLGSVPKNGETNTPALHTRRVYHLGSKLKREGAPYPPKPIIRGVTKDILSGGATSTPHFCHMMVTLSTSFRAVSSQHLTLWIRVGPGYDKLAISGFNLLGKKPGDTRPLQQPLDLAVSTRLSCPIVAEAQSTQPHLISFY